MGLSVRAALPHDADAVAALVNEAFRLERFFIEGDRTSPGEVRALLEKGAFLLTHGPDGRLLGCVYVEPRGASGYFGLLAVAPDQQRAGLGRRLVAAAEEHCRAAGCGTIELLLVNLREELPPFYRRLGYVEQGTKPFPPDPRLKRPCHFVVMSKALTPPPPAP